MWTLKLRELEGGKTRSNRDPTSPDESE